VLAVLRCYLRKSLNHKVQIIDFIAESILKGFQQIIQLLAGCLRSISKSGFIGYLFERLGYFCSVWEVLDIFTLGMQTCRSDEPDEA
jgi:hypothetical protein